MIRFQEATVNCDYAAGSQNISQPVPCCWLLLRSTIKEVPIKLAKSTYPLLRFCVQWAFPFAGMQTPAVNHNENEIRISRLLNIRLTCYNSVACCKSILCTAVFRPSMTCSLLCYAVELQISIVSLLM